MNTQRPTWEGAAHILRFNYPMFAAAAAVVAAGAAVLLLAPLPRLAQVTLGIVLLLTVAWAVATLLVSHLVYDLSALFTFEWLKPIAGDQVQCWANVHSGFDQTTERLRAAFPESVGVAVDLFDPAVMTERSIHRARAFYPAPAGTLAGRHDALPVGDASLQAVFMLFAAHELRSADQRAGLFREAARGLSSNGLLVVVEHLRGAANLVAFGPGAFHFFPRRSWLAAGNEAGLSVPQEVALTPFARAFIWKKSP